MKREKIKIVIKKQDVAGQICQLPYQIHSIHGAVTVRGVGAMGEFLTTRYEVGDCFTRLIVQAFIDNRENDVTVTL